MNLPLLKLVTEQLATEPNADLATTEYVIKIGRDCR